MTHRAVVSESDVAPHHSTHHVLRARAIIATGDVPSQRVVEASTKWSKRCDISRVTSEVRQIDEMTLFKPMNRGAIISLALDVSAPRSNARLQ